MSGTLVKALADPNDSPFAEFGYCVLTTLLQVSRRAFFPAHLILRAVIVTAVCCFVQEALGGACSTTVITTVRVGDFEGSAFVLDFVQIFKKIITFPVQNDGNLIGLMARIRQRIGFLQEQGKLAAAGGAGGGVAAAGHSAAEVQMLLLRLHDMEGKVRDYPLAFM
jgi:hypothetical protein